MKNYSRHPGSMRKSIFVTLLLGIIARFNKVHCSTSGRFFIFSSSGSSLPPEDVISSHHIDDEDAVLIQTQCAFLCLRNAEKSCVGFNIRVKRKNKQGVNCQLSNTTKLRKQKCDEEWKLFRGVDTKPKIDTSTNANVVKKFHAKFKNLGASGRFGPASLASYYVGKDHKNMVTVQNGTQFWTVPYTGTYEITAVGAVGGYRSAYSALFARGRGAYMRGEFDLNKGGLTKILVGQSGSGRGGGGGSFVVATSSNTPLIVAGGGGGITDLSTRLANCDASTGTSGRQNQCEINYCTIWSGGVNGSGAVEADYGTSGSGGGGFYSNGYSGADFGGAKGRGGEGGRGFIQGGEGGRGANKNEVGGFGGGGGAGWGGGGGGGYSGGANGDGMIRSCGGGGGSYNSGKNQENKEGFNSNGHGYVEIKLLP